MRRRFSALSKSLLGILFLLLLASPPIAAQDDAYDFALSASFLKKLYSLKTIQPVLTLHLDARSPKVHTLPDDCEIHIAGTPERLVLGDPNEIVVEPPNLCKYAPDGSLYSGSESHLRTVLWPELLDQKIVGKTCEVKGFFRIFTEHAQGSRDPANPNHVFEIHPALSIIAGNETLNFKNFLTALEGMGAIKPTTAASCIEDRTLYVRYNKKEKQYEFREKGGKCGNFAIVEVGNVSKELVHSIDGGHSAVARVSADGKSRRTLKLYTLTGSQVDSWLDDVMKGKKTSKRKMLHGLFTYDYLTIAKAVRTPGGQWLRPSNWIEVPSPLALVVFGETDTVPWEED
jgi:hypothetical protein